MVIYALSLLSGAVCGVLTVCALALCFFAISGVSLDLER